MTIKKIRTTIQFPLQQKGRNWTLLASIFAASAAIVRLILLQIHMASAVFQGDFSAYWAAGRGIAAGQNPYFYTPISPDGAVFRHSLFYYPPLAAAAFSFLGHLTYFQAKSLWSVLQLLLLLGGLALTARLLWPQHRFIGFAALAVAAAVFPPILDEFERGQIDCVTFFLITLSAWLWIDRQNSIAPAILLVLAAFCKLPIFLLLAVPLALRDFRFVKSALVALAGLGLLSIILTGPALNRQYWLNYLPLIANGGSPAPAQYDPALATATAPVVSGRDGHPHYSWEGRSYVDLCTFPSRGSLFSSYYSPLPNTMRKSISDLGYLFTLSALFMIGFLVRRTLEVDLRLLKMTLLAFGMTAILVFHTLSWLMNYVWLLFTLPVLLSAARRLAAPLSIKLILFSATALMFTWFTYSQTMRGAKLLNQRFCIAAILLYVCAGVILFLWTRNTSRGVFSAAEPNHRQSMSEL